MESESSDIYSSTSPFDSDISLITGGASAKQKGGLVLFNKNFSMMSLLLTSIVVLVIMLTPLSTETCTDKNNKWCWAAKIGLSLVIMLNQYLAK